MNRLRGHRYQCQRRTQSSGDSHWSNIPRNQFSRNCQSGRAYSQGIASRTTAFRQQQTNGSCGSPIGPFKRWSHQTHSTGGQTLGVISCPNSNRARRIYRRHIGRPGDGCYSVAHITKTTRQYNLYFIRNTCDIAFYPFYFAFSTLCVCLRTPKVEKVESNIVKELNDSLHEIEETPEFRTLLDRDKQLFLEPL